MKEILFSRTLEDHRRLVGQIKSKYLVADNVRIFQDGIDKIKRYVPDVIRENRYRPTIFFLPGTAFVARETSVTDVICSHISAHAKSQVICIQHDLAPEFQFPKSHLDAYKILNNVLKQSSRYKVDTTKIALMGYSSGGNFAVLLASEAAKNGVKFTCQVLISPVLDLSRSIQNFKALEEQDCSISDSFTSWFINYYAPSNVNRHDPAISPIWEDEECLRQLPPTDIIVADHDHFIGDSKLYAEKLKNAKVGCVEYEIPGDHSLLWVNLEVSKFIGTRMKCVFAQDFPYEPECYLSSENRLIIFIQHKVNSQEETKNTTRKIITLTPLELQKLLLRFQRHTLEANCFLSPKAQAR